jgi:hypothetical protein
MDTRSLAGTTIVVGDIAELVRWAAERIDRVKGRVGNTEIDGTVRTGRSGVRGGTGSWKQGRVGEPLELVSLTPDKTCGVPPAARECSTPRRSTHSSFLEVSSLSSLC